MKRTGTVHKSRRGLERDGKQHVRELDAYMTVEASFVIPMAAMKEGNTCPVPPQEEIFRDHYFMADSPSVSAADGSKVRVTASENMRGPAMQGFFLMPGGGWRLQGGFTARKTDPPAGFRKYKRILDLAARTGAAAGGSDT